MKKITPIILCGGSGTRLWPLSRAEYPKQFLNIIGDFSLFQQAVLRLPHLQFTPPICIANHEHRFIISEQLSELGRPSEIILEPEGRNTAPAIAAAIHYVLQSTMNIEQKLLILPADHYIKEQEAFIKAVDLASKLADENHILTFGIKPIYAETGYGYIHAKNKLKHTGLEVEKFIEKPNKSCATKYLEDSNYFWNSGMFLFNVKTMKNEMEKHCPSIWKKTGQAVNNHTKNLQFIELSPAFSKSPSISIDYAIMEKATSVAMVPLNCNWSDVGSFKSISELSNKNADNNTLIGDTIIINSQNNFVQSSEKRLIATVGITNTLIVDTPDSVLVAAKDNLQNIGEVVAELKKRKDARAIMPSRVHRPWGWYESLSSGDNYQVKRIHVHPGSSLSLQKHRYRSEHWVIIKGVANIHCDGKDMQLRENTSTFIPLGAVHRLANLTDKDLEIIEVQNGSYLGEDDIIRLEDDYQRT